ncbi:uncharacterized protein LOC126898273 [Daktulosphaira vitifoliae]|uniref:uncharacterized protein LOC126898273 n=1 Tax=Daktulosphaira vitifoliae TaxID=58002 RepID=UPI0021A9B572|nr:uncharacterized protein LOC126898273 [Daktulosphaira vitifoliae]
MAWNTCEGARGTSQLLPLKSKQSHHYIPCWAVKKPPREVWEYEGTGKCQRLRKRLIYPAPSPDYEPDIPGFDCTTEWKTAKPICTGLFWVLGKYYDETWFPTVIREWSLLYYQCNHHDDYWQYKNEWLEGDEEVRITIWAEILRHRSAFDKKREERKEQLKTCGKSDPDLTELDGDEEKVINMCELIDEANEVINVKRKLVDSSNCNYEDENAAVERCRLQKEMEEIAMADPDEEPDWVEMRRRMRGSFAALNLARHEIDYEMLDHIMIELCKYWAKAPPIEYEIDPLLERNITREIQNFRKKIFGIIELDEPEKFQCAPSPVTSSVNCQRQQSTCPSSALNEIARARRHPKNKQDQPYCRKK